MKALILLCVVATTYAQFEGGFIKILQDKRYQDGSTFGNFRDQEDGIKYFEETDAQNVRRGYWEYPGENGQILRTEFEAGPGIGFRITKSNIGEALPAAPKPPRPTFQPAPPAPVPVAPVHNPIPAPIPVHQPAPAFQPTPMPDIQNLFDYPGNLEFSRTNVGHRFKFTAA